MNGKEFKTSRRKALQIISSAIVGLVTFITARFTKSLLPARRRLKIEMRSDQIQVEHEIVVLRIGQKIDVLSRTCPHLGCKVKLDQTGQRFICPCHGSQFSLDGKYLQGPAKKNLKHLPFERSSQPSTIVVSL
ncbi:MAG: ubiquinol-cytochrome c reductase iron-sulfur subunit [Caldisericaceae bacterium]|nr:ubiquinol-cytochrome c reductase iron-sulfur subunit [Caldisericaceae bacterium]